MQEPSENEQLALKVVLEKPLLPILFVTLIAAHIALVWLLPYFPTQDGPSHLYNLSILKDLRSGGEQWGQIYTQQLSLKPNLGFHIIAYPLLYFFEPLVVEKLFISVYLLLLTSSVPALLKLIDRPVFPWSFLVFPTVLSYSLAMGFYSYVIALPLVLLAGGICWRFRSADLLRQCTVITICAAIIYCFHLIACGFFVILIAMQQLVTVRGSIGSKIWKTTLLLLPTGLLLLGYIISSAKEPQFISTSFIERFPTLITHLVLLGTVYFSPLQIINGVMLVLVFCLMLVLVFYHLVRFPNSLSLSEADMAFGGFCTILVIIYLCAPSSLGGGFYFNERIPQMILLGLIPVVAGRQQWAGISKRWQSYALTGLAIVSFAVNVHVYREKSALVEDYMSLQNTPISKKATIMSYRTYGIEQSRVDVLLHAVSYYALSHILVNVGNYEANLSYFPVKFLPEIKKALPSADSVNYYPQKVDIAKYAAIVYILSWKTEPRDHLLKFYSPVTSKGYLILWRKN